MKCRIAVVQCKISRDPVQNIKKMERYLISARGRADMVVFPELAITGMCSDNKGQIKSAKRYRRHVQDLAKKYELAIVPGSIIERQAKKSYNVSYYIDSKGRILGRYKKINLWHPERPTLSKGSDICVVDTSWGKVGLIICWDLMFPEIFRRMLKKGVHIVICPAFWQVQDAGLGLRIDKNSEQKLIDAVSVSRAFEHEIAFVFVNAAGSFVHNKRHFDLLGRSQITVPFKGLLQRIDSNREGMFIQDIDLGLLDLAEKVYKIRKDLGV